MTASDLVTSKRSSGKLYELLALSTLVLALFSLDSIWNALQERNNVIIERHFKLETQGIGNLISDKLSAHTQLLRGAAGLFAASGHVDRNEWHQFVEKLDLDQSFRGIQGIGFAQFLQADELDAHVQGMRKQGFPDYVIKPAGQRESYSSIIYLEPFSGRNLRAFGYDMYSDDVRRAAMEVARDTGGIALSGKVRLVQETEVDIQSGILAYHPIYSNGMLLQTVEQRRKALRGWVYSPYRMNDLMHSVLKSELNNIHLEVFDGDEVDPEALLYDNGPDTSQPASLADTSELPSVLAKLPMQGRTWTLRFTALPGFVAESRHATTTLEPIGFLAIGILLIGFTSALLNTRRKAIAIGLLKDTLVESEERYRSLFDRSQVAKLLADPESLAIVEANHAACSFYGYDSDEITALTLADIDPSLSPDRTGPSAKGANDHRRHELSKHRLANGSWRDVEILSNPIRLGGRSLVYYAVLDISERMRAEEENRKLAQVVEQIPMSVLITDSEGRIEYVNPAFTASTGYSFEEVRGQNPRLLKSGETPADVYQALWESLLSGRAWNGIFRNRRKNGSLYWEQVYIAPVFNHLGAVTHYLSVQEDISESRQREEEITAARDLADVANRAKSSFLANISHEIRTPLNAVLGLTEMALDTAVPPETADYLSKIQSASQTLLGIINGILDYSKIEAEQMVLDEIDFPLDGVITNIENLFALRAREKGIELSFKLKDSVPRWLNGDPLRLGQVLSNLVGNAVKFTEHGHVHVRVEAESITASGVTLGFSVHDTGIGLTTAQIATLYQPFSQADASTTRKFGGTGLGLAISRKLVHLMGGEIDVYSLPGQGSVFHFTAKLKLAKVEKLPELAQIERDSQPPERALALSGIKVLLVEDDSLNQQVGRLYLRKLGVEVDIVRSGAEAIAAVGKQAYDAVLMDLQMPEMSGLDASRRILQLPNCEALPIIAITASVTAKDQDACTAAGMKGHVAKPIDMNQLQEALLRCIPRAARPAKAVATASDPGKAEGEDTEARLRRIFTTECDSFLAGFRQAVTDADQAAAKALLHKLKGAAGNIGANELFDRASRLEQEMARDDQSGVPEFLEFVRDAMAHWQASRLADYTLAERPIMPFEPAEVCAELESMRERITKSRPVDAALLRHLQLRFVGHPDAPKLEKLVARVEVFDYPAALALLNELLTGITP
jgi:PAS domain S-box-containing protein